MTAKTTRNAGKDDAPEEVADAAAPEAGASESAEVAAEEQAGDAAGAAAPKAPAKRKRRVRVIEVIEDEDDLDEVLQALEAEDAEADEPERPKPAAKAKPAATRPTATKPKPAIVEDADEDENESEVGSETVVVQKASGGGGVVNLDSRAGAGGFSMSRNAAIVMVLVVAVLASLGIWQWTSASKLSGKEHDRDAVEKVATAYGDAVFNYNASNFQGQMNKVQEMLAGDLLELYKRCTVPNLGDNFKSNPGLSLKSQTSKVFVGDVDGRFATATIATDITVQSSQGSTSAPASLIRLSLAKSGGTWKVTQQFPSGVSQQSTDCNGSGQIPVSPNGQNGQPGSGGKPSSTPSAKPSN
ncbi:hypothetical protein [Actinomadura rupiterrae]|uniref:hypothetical protein n=1 Tax=Actinomadura rupiterrae TaxID=559627 RepID=UPI0020A2A83B|nr:hypothetical protein [Actinomadura rupiterrae]MCP2334773.1 hypothetical protein [Actinomadura rupiterrae]